MMPTYQRLIKKERIKAIREFISEGGFFSQFIDNQFRYRWEKKLRFDMVGNQVEEAISKNRILHLPQLYRSAYIIDGQHRLYGYSNLTFQSLIQFLLWHLKTLIEKNKLSYLWI